MLSIEQKLEGLPRIVYINLDEATERNDYMVSMFEKFGVKNYSRFGTKRPDRSKHKHLTKSEYGCLLSHIEVLSEFAKTNEPYLLVFEDDIDISLVEKWDFTWRDIFDRVGDFDILQLARLERHCVNPDIKFKKWEVNLGTTGAYVITNRYAKALTSLYRRNGSCVSVFPNFSKTIGPVADYSLYAKSNSKSLCIFWYKPFESQIAEVPIPELVYANNTLMSKVLENIITLRDIFE